MIDISNVFQKPILPADYGRVSYLANFHSEKVFVIISEIPCHQQIQKNIAHVLDFLSKHFPVKQIFQVYSCGPFQSKGIVRPERDDLEQKLTSGKITGAEYYVIRSHQEDLIFGVDKEQLFIKALQLHRKVSKNEEAVQPFIRKYKQEIEGLKGQYFTQENQIFNKMVDKRDQTESSEWFYRRLKQYLDALNLPKRDYLNLHAYIETLDNKDLIDYSQSSSEIGTINDRLKQSVSFASYRRLQEATDYYQNAALLALYLNRIAEIDPTLIADLPDAKRFITFQATNQKMNPVELVAEERRLVHEIFRHYATTFGEKEVVFLVEFIDALSGYFLFTSRDNYDFFDANVNRTFKKLWAKYTGGMILSEIAGFIQDANAYYQSCFQRGECFLQNSKVLSINPPVEPDLPDVEDSYHDMAISTLENAQEVYVFVTGGFHLSYLSQEFRKSNHSYVAIMPNVTEKASLPDCYQVLRNKIQAR